MKMRNPAEGPVLFAKGPDVVIVWLGLSGESLVIKMDLAVCATYLDIIDKYGIEHAHTVIRAGVNMARVPREEGVYEDEKQREDHNIASLLQALDRNREELANSEETILDLSYRMLVGHKWNRTQAAESASTLLGRRVETEAWRKRVDRWAAAKGYPPAGRQRGRKE